MLLVVAVFAAVFVVGHVAIVSAADVGSGGDSCFRSVRL